MYNYTMEPNKKIKPIKKHICLCDKKCNVCIKTHIDVIIKKSVYGKFYSKL